MDVDTRRNSNDTPPRQPDAALARGLQTLLAVQREDGHFCGELEGDSILQSEYILMKFILGQEDEPLVDGAPGRTTLEKLARTLRDQQRPDGGWGQYPGSGVDLSATVKAYFALKLLGDDAASPTMAAARDVARGCGGAEDCNSFTSFYLAALGQISWNAVPAIPPEIMFLPRWSYFHLTKVSAWTRTMIVPLSIVVTRRPTRPLPRGMGIDELFLDQRARHKLTLQDDKPSGWTRFFQTVDSLLKLAHRLGGTPFRRVALRRAETWLLARAGQDEPVPTDGLGAIFPPMVYLQIALRSLGYRRDDPVIVRAERELDAFFLEDGDRLRLQPCFSPVWDTGIALYALNDAGYDIASPPAAAAAAWLRDKECRHRGDWAANTPSDTPAAGWAFEYNNAWYPDVDDTAMVSMALLRTGGALNLDAAERGVRWILAMQNDDGGWAAFDRTRHRPILECIPFADHNAMQDPSCPDITGRVLECLAVHGFTVKDAAVRRAISYIRGRQEPDGPFFGRWGVNYLYGTWQAIVGPIRCGLDPETNWVGRAGAWVKSVQNASGAFGESANSYEDPSLRGQGPATASQTAWAAMTLQAIYGPDDPDLARAIRWLVETQLDETTVNDRRRNPERDPIGGWAETAFTGTGFPKVFYLRYHLYRLYFPVMALARFVREQDAAPIKLPPKLAEMRAAEPVG